MSKIKYRFNSKSLTYEKVEATWRQRIIKLLTYAATGSVFAVITIFLAYKFFSSPKEKLQAREIEQLRKEYDVLNKRLENMSNMLGDLQDRDDNIYRVVFESEPIPDNIRKAGFGGVDRYKELMGFENSELVMQTTQKLDRIAKQMYIQSKSFDEVIKLAKGKEVMLASIPAIQPISNKFLRHEPSGYGWRTHPIYKTQQFHPGMDFASPTGTPIYATGDGVVERADDGESGYGNHVVIDHGFGYETLYGHMSKIACKVGQKVKRGQVIGYVGSTGLSTAPHCHYEVIKNGEKINPINFYYNDLSPAEYQQLIELSSKSSQSFD